MRGHHPQRGGSDTHCLLAESSSEWIGVSAVSDMHIYPRVLMNNTLLLYNSWVRARWLSVISYPNPTTRSHVLIPTHWTHGQSESTRCQSWTIQTTLHSDLGLLGLSHLSSSSLLARRRVLPKTSDLFAPKYKTSLKPFVFYIEWFDGGFANAAPH